MPIELYSRNKRRKERGEQSELFEYNQVTDVVRVQIVHIWKSAIGPCHPVPEYGYVSDLPPNNNKLWTEIHDLFAREKGLFVLSERRWTPFDRCVDYFLKSKNLNDVLDLVQFTFGIIDGYLRRLSEDSLQSYGISQLPGDAIKELNFRFREASIGYQFESGRIVRVDNQYLHAEAVSPALRLLSDPAYKGANEEFLLAHQHYREHRTEDAITNALKSVESTLKAVCDQLGWSYPSNATASPLIKVVMSKGLLPEYLSSSFNSLQSTMEGLATIRNKSGAHGKGTQARAVPDFLAAYCLHLAASNIVLLIEASRSLPPS